ncbi:MAG TPA: hypothetical protein VK625_12430, partial [Flavitalea sp.]|nr:hypothetical protein [Flavitalea sp.]
MKYILLFFASLLFIQLQGQTYSFNDLLPRDDIFTDNSGKITITGVSKAEQKTFLVKDEAGNTNARFKIMGTNLVLNFSDTFAKNPSAIFRLVFPDHPNGLIIKSKNTTITPLKVVDASTQKTKFTGIAFWDAAFIYDAANNANCNDITKKEILEIIQAYKNNNTLGWKAASDNPFFQLVSGLKCRDTVIFKTAPPPGFAKPESGGGDILSGVLGSLGGIDVTNYVQAFADFLKERIRTELTLAYMEKLKTVLVKTPELKYLLPKTYHVFTTNDIYNIPSMGVVYKSAFAEDLNNLVENFEDMVFTLPKYDSLKTSEGFITFMLSYHYADLSAKGHHPSDILFQLDTRYGYTKQPASKTAYTLSVLNMLSMNLRDTSANQGWVNKNDLRLINKDFMYIFFGLLYEKNQALFDKSFDGKTLKDIILGGANITDQVHDLLIVANNIDTRIREFKAMSAAEKKESALALFLNNADEIAALFDF